MKQTVSKLTHRGVSYLKYFGQSNLSKFMFSADKKCLILDIHFKGKYMANTNLFHTNKINNHLFCVPKMHFSVWQFISYKIMQENGGNFIVNVHCREHKRKHTAHQPILFVVGLSTCRRSINLSTVFDVKSLKGDNFILCLMTNKDTAAQHTNST